MKSGRFGLLPLARPRAAGVLVLLGCAMLPPAVLQEGLASAAGITFEAVPLILATSLIRGRCAKRVAALFGCGCGHAVGPAALSLPAAILCWSTFGPWIALARFGAALLLDRRRRHALDPSARADPLAEIAAVTEPALLLGFGSSLLASAPATFSAIALPAPIQGCLAGIFGCLLGTIMPCSTAAVALAAMLRGSTPAASVGILATAGLVPFRAVRFDAAVRTRDGRVSLLVLAVACGALAVRGGSGFVHPRLIPLVWLGIPCALACARRAWPTASPRHGLAPAIMLAALVLGSPIPHAAIATGTWDGVYPGEVVRFTAPASLARGSIVLTRYAITCCRADASLIVVPTDLRQPIISGAWYCVEGVVAGDGARMYLRVRRLSRVPAPTDPYLYR